MTSIYDVPYEDISMFLIANNEDFSNEGEAYNTALALLKDKNAIGHTTSIIEWMMAHNLLINKVNIASYTVGEIDNMSQKEIDRLAKLLTMKGNNRQNIKNILKFLNKLYYSKSNISVEDDILKNKLNELQINNIDSGVIKKNDVLNKNNLDDPNQIQVGNVGTYQTGGRYGRAYWDGFVVTRIISPGKKIEVEFDTPIDLPNEPHDNNPKRSKTRILEYRRPGRWMFKGLPAKDMFGHISMGQKRTEVEQGWF